MAQFVAYENLNKATRKTYPHLLDVQSDLLGDLRTTVVLPLSPTSLANRAVLTRLNPVLQVEGSPYVVLTQQIAGIDRKHLGRQVDDLSEYRAEIVAALDFLVSGF